MKRYAVAGGLPAAAFIVFAVLAQTHIILVPYFTPAILRVEGLRQEYSIGEDLSFIVTVEGYGSNCHMLQVETLNDEGERVSYYRKADDCRFMIITHGPYNFTRPFEYDGQTVISEKGIYKMDFQFEDLVDGTKVSETRTLNVK